MKIFTMYTVYMYVYFIYILQQQQQQYTEVRLKRPLQKAAASRTIKRKENGIENGIEEEVDNNKKSKSLLFVFLDISTQTAFKYNINSECARCLDQINQASTRIKCALLWSDVA